MIAAVRKDHACHALYTPNMACPGCGMSNWIIGIASAECGRCGTALELPRSTRSGGEKARRS